ncbi:MAG: hypothetical protein K2X66_13700, partial [Cyanobacteria bacterium]|nr:hypothetical protein [Cyanobacteriota bacterium]
KADPRPKLLLMGDSIMDFDLFPEQLENTLQKRGYLDVSATSFAVASSTPRISIVYLRGLIKKGLKPKMIVYNVHPRILNHFFAGDPTQNSENTFFETYTARCEFQEPTDDWGKSLCLLEKNSYLLRFRSFWRDTVAQLPAIWLHPELTLNPKIETYTTTDISPKGWMAGYQVTSAPKLIQEHITPQFMFYYQKKLGHYQWDPAPLQAFHRFCQNQGIPVAYVWLPEYPYMEKIYAQLHFDTPLFQKKLQHLMGDFSREPSGVLPVELLDFHTQVYPAESYQDFNHLNVNGAPKFSEDLGLALTESKTFQKAFEK